MDGLLSEPEDPVAQASASAPSPGLTAHWLGRIGYRDAWDLQKALAGARASGAIGDQLLLLEHPAVLTLGRGAAELHVLAPAAMLEARGIELLRVERGGEVTYHGPGQLVAYPIVRLADRDLLLRPFVRALEAALVETCAAFGVAAERRDGHPGCWVDAGGPRPRKIGALGIRIERGTSYHGIALNVDVDLADFGLIDPCGMPGLDFDIHRPRSRAPGRGTLDRAGRRGRRHLRAGLRGPDRRPARRDAPTRCRPGGRAGRARRPPMSQGLFELRKDAITGWWVATMVDRTFARERFALPAAQVDDHGDCFNCRIPAGDGVRLRTLKDFAFTVAGTEEEARTRDGAVAQVTIADARAAGAWRTAVAPPGEHRALHQVGNGIIEELLRRCRDEIVASRAADRTQYLQVVQNWGAQAGARTNHCCFDLYDLPQIPHRIAEELGGAARFLIREGECPYCRLVRDEVRRGDRLLYADGDAVAFAPWASRSAFEVWVVPRRHDADFARASDRDIAAAAEALRSVLAKLAASLDGPPYNLVLHSAPLKEQVDATYHWHWEIHPRLREIAGLELGTGLPVNPVSPEDAVDELRTGPDAKVPMEHPRR